jgi:predicted AlkP superfamily pyrophosphatase or phosphodiesterase
MIYSNSISALTPTICELMGLLYPNHNDNLAISDVIKLANKTKIEKGLIFCPDAIGKNIFDKFPMFLANVKERAQHQVLTNAEFPSLTPVCFASMFTGVRPDIHGIKKYERPILKTKTLFDSAIDVDYKVSIVAVKDSSIDLIFREKKIDYYSEANDSDVSNRVNELISQDNHQLIIAYICAHDDALHNFGTYSEQAISAVESNIEIFNRANDFCEKYWKNSNYLVVFAPDHGSHIDKNTGKGTHGSSEEDDMTVFHFYKIKIDKSLREI